MNSVWYLITKDGSEYIATLSDTQELASVGAHAANGPFVKYPFTIERPANPEEIDWAESEREILQTEAELS